MRLACRSRVRTVTGWGGLISDLLILINWTPTACTYVWVCCTAGTASCLIDLWLADLWLNELWLVKVRDGDSFVSYLAKIFIGWFLNYLNCDWLQVQGGDSERLGRANYHPFYITTSRTGGFARKLDVEKGGTWIVLQKKLQQLCITVYKNEM
jgi:hypothetical protein